MGEGLPGSHPHAKFYHFGLVDVGLRPKKSPKMVIFGKNLPLGKNSWGQYENLNISAQLQTFLYAMTP